MTKQEQLITPSMIAWARKRLGDSMEAFARRMGVSIERVTNWENGIAFMTYAQIKRLADQSLLPVGLFFLEDPPELSIGMTDFRNVRERGLLFPSPELYAVISTMKYRQAWYRDYLLENECVPLDMLEA